MYRNYSLYLVKHFVVALTNVFYGEAGVAALIDTFCVGTGDGMPSRDKMTAFFGETCFLFCLIIALLSYRNQT